jgi:glutamate racemase
MIRSMTAFAAASGIELFSRACPRFVEFVEAGVTSGPELFAAAEEYLAPLRDAGIDTLVLGCTHYPLMSAAIQYVIGQDVRLVSSADETAADLYRVLVSNDLERTAAEAPTHTFESTGDDELGFRRLAARFLGPEVTRVETFETGAITLPRS